MHGCAYLKNESFDAELIRGRRLIQTKDELKIELFKIHGSQSVNVFLTFSQRLLRHQTAYLSANMNSFSVILALKIVMFTPLFFTLDK